MQIYTMLDNNVLKVFCIDYKEKRTENRNLWYRAYDASCGPRVTTVNDPVCFV